MSLQNFPFGDCLYCSSGSFSRAMTQLAEKSFAPAGLSPSHAFLLMAVMKLPGTRVGELGKVLGLKASTLTRLVDKMEKKGLLRRVNSGRHREVFPTELTRQLLPLLDKCWQQLQEEYAGALGQETSTKLARLLSEARAEF